MFIFGLLAIGELVMSIKTSHGPDSLNDSFKYFLVVGIPLLFVFSSIYLGQNLRFPIFLGWVCILTGFLIHYGYYTTHDPSKAMILGVSVIIYWLCGVLALISVCYQEP